MDGFPFSLETQDTLIKSTGLLHRWSSLKPLTLMEETTYQKLIHFKTFSILCFCFFFVLEIKEATHLNVQITTLFP